MGAKLAQGIATFFSMLSLHPHSNEISQGSDPWENKVNWDFSKAPPETWHLHARVVSTLTPPDESYFLDYPLEFLSCGHEPDHLAGSLAFATRQLHDFRPVTWALWPSSVKRHSENNSTPSVGLWWGSDEWLCGQVSKQAWAFPGEFSASLQFRQLASDAKGEASFIF